MRYLGLEGLCFRFVVIECGGSLSSIDIVPFEFLEYAGYGGVMDSFVDECVNVDCMESLGEVY